MPTTDTHFQTGSPATAGAPDTMVAAVRYRYGDTAEMAIVDRPTPGPRQVLLRVAAAGIDRGVWHLATGLPYPVRLAGFGLRRPKQPILGLDVAGVVEAVGDEVTRFEVGDSVFGIGHGSYAQYAAADEAKLAHKPTTLRFEQAAGATVSGITALQALTDVGRVRAGQRVLVLGASGGVGAYSTQLAVALGAEVTGVASGSKLDLVRELGAAEAVDYQRVDITTAASRWDLVIDTGGNTPIRRLRRILSPGGTLVIVGGENGGRLTGGSGRQLRALLLSPFVGHRLTTFVSSENTGDIERLARHLEEGSVIPPVGSRYHLAEVADALTDLTAGRIRGKGVIVVDPALV
jgi:NADPH:quinone reductase-like Zn-dependent oxidoreductase